MDLTELGLEAIKNRYFSELLGEVKHLPECEIYRVQGHRFCSCGLLHDLNFYFIFSDLAEIIYPDCQKDLYLQENQKEFIKRTSKKTVEKLEELFGPVQEDKQELEEDYRRQQILISMVFGNLFPNAVSRLKQRLQRRCK